MKHSQVVAALKSGLNTLIAAETEITEYDTMVGDGDCGLCLKGGAQAILAEIEKHNEWSDAVQLISRIAHVVESNMDGTSGALYAIFLNSLAYNLSLQDKGQASPTTAKIWAKALQGALTSLGKYTPARPGDRTMVDALQPFVNTLVETEDFTKAVEAAKKGSESTQGMEASLGRSVYVGGDNWKKVPDPGAFGLAQLLAGINLAL